MKNFSLCYLLGSLVLPTLSAYAAKSEGPMENRRFYSDYQHLEKDMTALYDKLPKKKWMGIIAVARGGLYPSLFLAHKLNLRKIETLSIASYGQDEKQGHLTLLSHFNFADKNQGQDWLVVDDLSDSGKTLTWIRGYLPNAHYAVVYAKPQGQKAVDTYGKEIPQTTWIEFPWEQEDLLEKAID